MGKVGKLILGVVVVVLVGLGGWLVSSSTESQRTPQQIFQPSEADIIDPEWLPERRDAQLATVDQFEVFYDFNFTDRVEDSGITFSHKIVDNGGKYFLGVHYDHGNGLAIADVDNDGLYDIYFVNQVGSNELWRNRGDGTFENITEAAGVALNQPISVTASFADTDNDGDQDLFVTTVRFGNYLFENDGTGTFTDISVESGLRYVGHSSGAVFFDYNRDGRLDLFLTNVGVYTKDELVPIVGRTRLDKQEGTYTYYAGIDLAFSGHLMPERDEQSILYRNVGNNHFIGASAETGLLDTSWSGDATPMDINEDGWPDLYVLNMQGNDTYYENVEGKRFVNKSRAYFPKTPWGAMGVKVFDYNNDGRMDLYITDMHSDMWETDFFIDAQHEKMKPKPENVPPEAHMQSGGLNIDGNALFRNDGEGRFTDVTDAMGAETYWPWGFSVADLNADGFEDVFIAASMNFPFRYAVNSVLLNNRGKKFLDSEFILGVEPRRDGRTAKLWFEVDCIEEDVDHGVCHDYPEPRHYDIWAALGSRASVVFDLDDDGDLDIVTNDYNAEPMVLISDLAEQKADLHYLKVKLRGTTSNRDGLGAVVTVYAGGQAYTKVYDGKSGYLSQSAYPLYFGLGEADTLEKIDVLWPSGMRQTVPPPVAINRLVEIVEEE